MLSECRRLVPCALLTLLLSSACAAPAPTVPAPGSAEPPVAPPGPPKAMVVGLSVEPLTLGPFEIGGTWHQGPIYQIMHDFLVVHDNEGRPIPHLGEERPSIERGSWKVFPTQAQIITDLWKAIGLQANIFIPAAALMANLEFQADVKGVETSGYPITFGTWQRRVHSAAIPTPANRYSGLNRTYYENPEVDGLIDRFMVTLDGAQREQLEGEIIERVTRDAAFYPLNINAQASVIRKGITGLKPVSGTPSITAFYYTTWNIVEWDRQ